MGRQKNEFYNRAIEKLIKNNNPKDYYNEIKENLLLQSELIEVMKL